MPLNLTERDGACVFDVLLSPRASRPRIGPIAEGRLRVAVTAPPVAGEANDALCRLLAQSLARSWYRARVKALLEHIS